MDLRKTWIRILDHMTDVPKFGEGRWHTPAAVVFRALLYTCPTPMLLVWICGTSSPWTLSAVYVWGYAGITSTLLAAAASTSDYRQLSEQIRKKDKQDERDEPPRAPEPAAPPEESRFLIPSFTKHCGAIVLLVFARAKELEKKDISLSRVFRRLGQQHEAFRGPLVFRMAYGFALAARCAKVLRFTITRGRWVIDDVHPSLKDPDKTRALWQVVAVTEAELDKIIQDA